VILGVTTSLLNMKRLVSSAYNLTVLKGNPLPISFTCIRKSSGPSTEPFFQHGRHEPEVVVSHYLRYLSEPYKSYFIGSAHDKQCATTRYS